MIEEWTADVVGRMHLAQITGQQLADECGYSASYLSTVLNGRAGTDGTKTRILEALERLEKEARAEFDKRAQAQTEAEAEADAATDGESVCDQ